MPNKLAVRLYKKRALFNDNNQIKKNPVRTAQLVPCNLVLMCIMINKGHLMPPKKNKKIKLKKCDVAQLTDPYSILKCFKVKFRKSFQNLPEILGG